MAALLLPGLLPAGAAEWTWSQMSTGAPTTTSLYTRVFWTGHELLVWGAQNPDSSGPYVHRAWRWSPKTRAVRPISLVNAPAVPAYSGQSSVWTGRHLLVWGGRSGSATDDDTNNGYLYDPLADSWQKITEVDAPTRRLEHGAVWTGEEMFVWGGYSERHRQFPRDFGAFDPAAQLWRHWDGESGPPGRRDPSLVFTGDKILVWGGWDLEGDWMDLHWVYFNDLHQLDPRTGAWAPLPGAGAPSARKACATVWTGEEFVVWGGYNGRIYANRTVLSDGARYRPAENRWLPMNPVHPLGPRELPDAVWTGEEVVFWGGTGRLGPGGRYNPRLDSWAPISTNGAPSWVQTHNMAWAGDMVLAIDEDVFALAPEGPFRADGLPDAWQERFFAGRPAVAGPGNDPDGDDWSNELEWRFGTDPTEAASRPALRIELGGGVARVSFPDPDPLLGFQLQATEDLRMPFTALAVPATRARGWIQWSVPSQARDAEFFRLVVTTP